MYDSYLIPSYDHMLSCFHLCILWAAICRLMNDVTCSVPDFTCVSPAKVVFCDLYSAYINGQVIVLAHCLCRGIFFIYYFQM